MSKQTVQPESEELHRFTDAMKKLINTSKEDLAAAEEADKQKHKQARDKE
jgi:hypothetical protein